LFETRCEIANDIRFSLRVDDKDRDRR
jgi:hypothetical protein